ncbi:retrovirus-related pol polyprotein from transposon TNT 1-94, partial [Tanacetum coccineum]
YTSLRTNRAKGVKGDMANNVMGVVWAFMFKDWAGWDNRMNMEQFQVNTKFLNSLPPEWSKFMADVKLVKDLHTSNFDQLHAYLEQHELHANEVRFAVPVFSPGDDPIACLNKAMAFLTAIASSSNATSSRGNTTSGHARVAKCYNCQGEGHMARQCTQPKRPRNAAWYKEKEMLAEVQEAGQILDEE